MANKKQNVLITGARGFIGKNLVEYLGTNFKDKYSLFFPYHKELELTDTEAVDKYINNNGINNIVHCAFVGGSRKNKYDIGEPNIVMTNLQMFFNLYKHIDKIDRMICLGSGAEYDKTHYIPNMSEEYFGKYIPKDSYGFSKYSCAKLIEKEPKLTELRLFGIYGKYEDYSFRFISNAIVRNLLSLSITINQNVNFDYLFVNDLMPIIAHFMDKNTEQRAYNVTTGSTVDLLSIANIINSISKKPSKIEILNKGFNVEYSGSNKRLLSEKMFVFTPHEKAIQTLYDYYKSIINTIDKETIIKDEAIKCCITKK